MSTSIDVPRLVDGVRRAAARAETADELLEAVASDVGQAVPYDGAMWFGVDPSSMLPAAPSRMEHLDDGYCHTFWYGEFHEHDVNLFTDLARQRVPAASLLSAIGDQPMRSTRYREFMRPQGYADELRAAFRVGRSTWAVAALLREKGRAPFGEGDTVALQAVSSVVGDAMRRMATDRLTYADISHSPGLMLFDETGALLSANNEATSWLEDIYGADAGTNWVDVLTDPHGPDLRIALPLIPLLARARAVGAGRAAGPSRLRLRDRAGRWVVLHASRLEGEDKGAVAVVVEPAKSAEIAPIIVEAYGLTPRERDVVRAIARGLSTPDIAAELFLSPHTVRDHVKAVLDKIGVGSRAELVAKLFGEHYSDPFHQSMVHID